MIGFSRFAEKAVPTTGVTLPWGYGSFQEEGVLTFTYSLIRSHPTVFFPAVELQGVENFTATAVYKLQQFYKDLNKGDSESLEVDEEFTVPGVTVLSRLVSVTLSMYI